MKIFCNLLFVLSFISLFGQESTRGSWEETIASLNEKLEQIIVVENVENDFYGEKKTYSNKLRWNLSNNSIITTSQRTTGGKPMTITGNLKNLKEVKYSKEREAIVLSFNDRKSVAIKIFLTPTHYSTKMYISFCSDVKRKTSDFSYKCLKSDYSKENQLIKEIIKDFKNLANLSKG